MIGAAMSSMSTLSTAPALIAWLPFIDPLPAAYRWWWLSAIPLLLGISMVYKAYRLPTLEHYWRQVFVMTLQILLAMVLFAAALFVIVLWLVPRLPVE